MPPKIFSGLVSITQTTSDPSMPVRFRRQKRKRTWSVRRKGVKRRRFRRKRWSVTARSNRGFPKVMFMTHKYHWTGTLDPAAGLLDYNTFRLNSVYDPDWSGVGAHQPRYHDEMAALYANYEVTSTKAKITFYPNTTDGFLVGSIVHEGTTRPSDIYDLAESPHAKTASLMYGASVQPITYWHKCRPMSFMKLGSRGKNISDSGANPDDVVYLSVCAGAADGVSNPAALRVVVTLYQRVKWSQPKQAPAS